MIALVAVAPAAALVASTTAATAAPSEVGEICERETYLWSGSATLGAGTDEVDTGVSIPAMAGTDLVAVGASADGRAADGTAQALRVTVGGTPVLPGTALPGGRIVVHHEGAEPVEIVGASVVVDRCRLVQSAPSPAPALRLPGAPSPAEPDPPVVAPKPRSLPTTGTSPLLLAALASALVAVGLTITTAATRTRRLRR